MVVRDDSNSEMIIVEQINNQLTAYSEKEKMVETDSLSEAERGESGFGSIGK